MIWLKQSTASQEIPLGYFLDSSDGDTEETALTINNTDIKIWKNGATSLASKNSGGATHMSNGIYYCTLDATDTNTLGPMTIFVHVSGALTVKVDCMVLAANVYDSLVAGTDNLEINLSTQAKADVNTEVDDVLNTDTKAELASVPAANASLGDDIKFLAMFARNGGTHNRNTGALTVNNDSGTAIGTCTVSDTGGSTGTLTRGKMS